MAVASLPDRTISRATVVMVDEDDLGSGGKRLFFSKCEMLSSLVIDFAATTT